MSNASATGLKLEIGRRDLCLGMAALGVGLALPVSKAAAASSTASDLQTIKDRGQLIVGMTDFDSAPFYFSSKKVPSEGSGLPVEGWDVQLAKDIAQVLDVKVSLDRKGSSYNAIIDQLANGTIDIGISKLSITPKRAVRVQFSHPTIELRHALLANRLTLARKADDGDLRSVINRDFDGRVGVIAKSSYADVAKQVFARAEIREYDDWDNVIDAVERGDVDLAYRDELEVKKLMKIRPELHLNLRSVLITDIKDYIAVALPYSSVQLNSIVNVILEQRPKMNANQLLDAYPNLFTT